MEDGRTGTHNPLWPNIFYVLTKCNRNNRYHEVHTLSPSLFLAPALYITTTSPHTLRYPLSPLTVACNTNLIFFYHIDVINLWSVLKVTPLPVSFV
jgi:hypothetical protein